MPGPTVTLTFAGDSDKLEKAFDGVGAASKKMASEVDSASSGVTSSLDRAGSGIDTTGTKAGDLESGFRGVTDSMSGFARIAQGDVLGGLTDLAGGAEALATGFSGVLIPALKRGVAWLGQTRVGILAMAVAQKVAAAATVAWTVVQRVLNAVMRANPIGIVITVLALLVGAIVLAWKKSETFRKIVTGAWNAVKLGAQALWGVIKFVFSKVTSFIGASARLIGKFVSGMWDGMVGGLRSALNGAIFLLNRGVDAINGIISGINFVSGAVGIPAIPHIPHVPTLHQGGIMPGAPGTEGLALLQAGERVTSAGLAGREPRTVFVDLGPAMMKLIRQQVRAEGGNVQIVLGQG